MTAGPDPNCRRCRKPLRWAVTEKGRRMPLDSFPDQGGNVVLLPEGKCRVLGKEEAAAYRAESRGSLWMPHFATCSARPRARSRQ